MDKACLGERSRRIRRLNRRTAMEKVVLVIGLLAWSLVSSQAAEIDACSSDRVKTVIMNGTFNKLKASATEQWLSGAPGINTPQIKRMLQYWTGAIVNVRQTGYDNVSNVRYCSADFEYQNVPP